MKHFLCRAVCFSCLMFFAVPVFCAEKDVSSSESEAPVSLGDLYITPRRIPGRGVEESSFPGSVTVISEPQIQASKATTVVDLLAQAEGVSVMDSRGFGFGADSGVNLRGFVNSSRTDALVLVNGIRQNRITGDEVHWAAIPPEQIERIEIIRGGGGTIYGEGALSGVINIITKRGGTKPVQFEGSAETGSYNLFRTTDVVRGTKDRFSYSVGVTRETGSGYRDRTDFRATTTNLFTGWTVRPGTQLELTASNHDGVSGFAGGITKDDVEKDRRKAGSFSGFFDDHIHRGSVQLAQEIGPAWTAVGNIFLNKWDSDSVTTSHFGSVASTEGAGLRASHEKSGGIWKTTTTFGLDLTKDKAVTGSRGGDKSESNRIAQGYFIEEALELFKRLTLTAGFRYDKSRYLEDLTFPSFAGTLRFSGRSPRLGANYSVNDRINLYASAARAFKAPNIDDLDAVLPPFNDSVDVKPQQADHYEVGTRWQAARWAKVKLDGFLVHTKDEILFNPATFANANYTTRRAGAELNVSGELKPNGLSYYATYTLMRAGFHKGEFTGYEIPATPRHRATGGVSCPLTEKLSGKVDFLWVGRQFRVNDFYNKFSAKPYGVVNSALEYRFAKVKAYLKVLNLLDKEYESFPSSSGTAVSTGENPAPPRTWLAGVSCDF